MKELLERDNTNFGNSKETIVSCFKEQVAKDGGKIALSWSSGKMDYAQLDTLSNQMAHVLINKFSVEESDCVGVVLPKSETLIVALLAVLKCDATYVPIHPDYEEQRKEFIINDTSCKLIIDENFVEKFASNFRRARKSAPKVAGNNENIVYIMYPSEVSGESKGVMIKHSNIIAMLRSCAEQFEILPSDSWSLFHSHCVDFSVWEIFGCLLSGGKLVIIDDQEIKKPTSYVRLMNDNEVNLFSQTPSEFYHFVEANLEIPSLRYVVLGGEPLSISKIQDWYRAHPKVALISMYGATETTVHSTFKMITEETLKSDLRNLGKPLSFNTCYVLNKDQELVPYGESGELYIAGKGVAHGYLNNPELDSKLFVNDPFSGKGQMYRTGDMVRYLPNGELEYLGKAEE